MPDWLNWTNAGKFLLLVPGWIAFALTLRKAWFERTILQFTIRATHVSDEQPKTALGIRIASPIYLALSIGITNNGLRPITVKRVSCTYAYLSEKQEREEFTSHDWLDQKIGQGDHCTGYPKIYSKPIEIVSAALGDSSGKEWLIPQKMIKALNARGERQWE
jgi:hypothetical protein